MNCYGHGWSTVNTINAYGDVSDYKEICQTCKDTMETSGVHYEGFCGFGDSIPEFLIELVKDLEERKEK
jgi:hypothetical protein